MDNFCRLCGSEDGIKVSIFEPGTEYVKKIHKILPITVNEHDPLPNNMCHRCSFKVNEFYEFRTNCIKSQELFKSKVPWLKDKPVTCVDKGQPPMVELPLNSLNSISPNEKKVYNKPRLIDENDTVIVIEEDDSLSHTESSRISNSLNDCGSGDKIIMKIKKCDVKKRPKTRSMWDTKRRRKQRKSCTITRVFTTSIDEYQSIGDIENDPLHLSSVDQNDNGDTFPRLSKSPKNDQSTLEKGILTDDKTGENVALPKHILVTKIPRVGFVYTCERCGRTFLSPQPASLHNCVNDVDDGNDDRSQDDVQDYSSNTVNFYNCSDCSEMFPRHSQLVTHQKKHFKTDSSSDDTFTPFNQRKKHHIKKKSKPTSLSYLNNFNVQESGITRHSLLSSDSE